MEGASKRFAATHCESEVGGDGDHRATTPGVTTEEATQQREWERRRQQQRRRSGGGGGGRRRKSGGGRSRSSDDDDRASVLAEGQPRRGEKVGHEWARVSCELSLPQSGRSIAAREIDLAEATSDQSSIAMERVSCYTSDEWDEETALSSDTSDDDVTSSSSSSSDSDSSDDADDPRVHLDPESSDDDDPRSQVDRLIERGTLIYMDGENSALSSEAESDDESSSSDYDSESDITDVSPLISAATSPVGLSPVLPRRTVPTSPLALHDNRDLYAAHRINPFHWDRDPPRAAFTDAHLFCDNRQPPPAAVPSEEDSTSMKLLLQAVIELENHNNRKSRKGAGKLNRNALAAGIARTISTTTATTTTGSGGGNGGGGGNNGHGEPLYIHPIRDNPHHTHLNKGSGHKRKNMSFSNQEVHEIDRENRILLRKLISAHTRNPPAHVVNHHRYHHKPSTSSVNRKRDEQKIRKENLLLLRKIQEAKPSKDVTMEKTTDTSPQNTLRSASAAASCGASMRSLSRPSVRTPPRKETAL